MPDATTTDPDAVTSLDFATWARCIAMHMRAMELEPVPGFRSPPRDPNVTRTIRWRAPGEPPVVAVAVKGRTRRAVLLDLLAGACRAAGLMPHSPTAGQLRGRVIADLDVDVSPPDPHAEEPY